MNLIIHHWDTDGICSAAIIASVLEDKGEDWVNTSPLPGIFEFDERIYKMADEADKVFVADLNMPESVEKLQSQVFYFDHHLQEKINKKNVEHINPVIHGIHDSCPSTTWVVSEYFNRWNHLSALGVVGDTGQKAFDMDEIIRLLNDSGLTREDFLKLATLTDSPSVVGDRKGVESAVRKVKDIGPLKLLDDDEWNRNLRKATSEINRVVEDLCVIEGIAYVEFSSNYNIISKVARKLVWDLNYKAAFVVNRNYYGYSQVYLRVRNELSGKFRISELIDKLKHLDINAGGKKEVLGVVCELNSLGNVIEIIKRHLGWKNDWEC